MAGSVASIGGGLWRTARDLAPILAVVALFQVAVVGAPPADLGERAIGLVLLLVGLALFVRGLETTLFPLGESLAEALARRGSVPLLVGFGFALGFGSTVAEPALYLVADEAAALLAQESAAGSSPVVIKTVLRIGVATAVGFAVAIGVLRILMQWPIVWLVLPGYGLAAAIALLVPTRLSDIAFDAGAAATSAINIPLMLALGIGLAGLVRGRDPLVDGFGLVALASLMPMLAVLLAGIVLA